MNWKSRWSTTDSPLSEPSCFLGICFKYCQLIPNQPATLFSVILGTCESFLGGIWIIRLASDQFVIQLLTWFCFLPESVLYAALILDMSPWMGSVFRFDHIFVLVPYNMHYMNLFQFRGTRSFLSVVRFKALIINPCGNLSKSLLVDLHFHVDCTYNYFPRYLTIKSSVFSR